MSDGTTAWKPVPELFELVTWADIRESDHVWSMGGVCVITRGAFRNDDFYDRDLAEGHMRFGHRNESGSEFAPPMELAHHVPRLIPSGRRLPVNRIWRSAKRELLRSLIHLAYRKLHRSTTEKEN
jgi:hypothetical protein